MQDNVHMGMALDIPLPSLCNLMYSNRVLTIREMVLKPNPHGQQNPLLNH